MKTYTKIWPVITVLFLTALTLFVLISMPIKAAGPWYVAQTGNDSNSCLAPDDPCATINGTVGKATSSDTIYVATGAYSSSTGDQVVLLNKSAVLSGGWDTTFSVQSGISTIDGGGVRRGITLSSGVTVVIEHFAIQNGSTLFIGGGGILNHGTLSLNDSIVSNNTSCCNSGGGIYNDNMLTLINSTVSGNTAPIFYGGGIHNHYGVVTLIESTVSDNNSGIHNAFGTVTLTNSAVNANTNESIGGIFNQQGTLILTQSTVSDNMGSGIINHGTVDLNNSIVSGNISQSGGGGIFNVPGNTVTLTNSTVSGNTSSGSGGGIANGGNLTLINSTVNGNTSQDSGGGIINFSNLILTNSTVSGNISQDNGGGISNYNNLFLNNSTVSGNASNINGGGIWNNADFAINLQNSIIAANTAPGTGADCTGSFDSYGYNLIGDASGCTFNATTGDMTHIGANLWPYLFGSPGVHPLLPESPAIDAGNPDGCKDNLGNPLDTDQRGIARVGRCDIGAYEFDPANPLRILFLPLVSKP